MKTLHRRCIALAFAVSVLGLSRCAGSTFDDVDRLSCILRPPIGTPVPSSTYDGVANDKLEDEARARRLTAAGRAAARVLAERYERGEGVGRDLLKAGSWYRAAALVVPETRYIYVPGVGNSAGSLLPVGASDAVSPGDPIAMRRLGEMYRDSIGVPLNMMNTRRANALIVCAAAFGVTTLPRQPMYGPAI